MTISQYIQIFELLYCTPEINTMLYVNYNSIKNIHQSNIYGSNNLETE